MYLNESIHWDDGRMNGRTNAWLCGWTKKQLGGWNAEAGTVVCAYTCYTRLLLAQQQQLRQTTLKSKPATTTAD